MEQLEQNLYEILGLTPDASEETIRRVITDKSVQLNRKIPMAATLETKRKAENELQRITEARHHLLDGERRKAYDASLVPLDALPGTGPVKPPAAAPPKPPPTAQAPHTQERKVPPPPPKPPVADDRPCPMCGERIKVSAAMCRFCHTVFDQDRANSLNSGNLKPPPPPLPPPPAAPAAVPSAVAGPGTAPLAPPPSNAGLSVIIAFIAIVGVGVGIMIAKQNQPTTIIQQVPAPAPTEVYVAPAENAGGTTAYEPPAEATPTPFGETDMYSLMQNWQGIKRTAFMGLDTSRLSEVLTGKALEDTTKAISWCSDPANEARYPNIELVSMSVNWVNQTDAYSATAAVTIEEIKEFSVKSKCKRTRSSYVAEYLLRNEAGTWRIADIPNIQTTSKSNSACQ